MNIIFSCIVFAVITLNHVTASDKFHHLYNLKSATSDEKQAKAAYDVIKRVLPEKAHFFKVTVDNNYTDNGMDKFTIHKNGNIIEITANAGVVATWGFNYYLKYYCNVHIGWQIQQITTPNILPDINVTVISKDRFRYYQNVCTTSYSFVWWNLKDWRKHIDWIALNGFNIVLAPHAQEAIWKIVYEKINLTNEEIQEHFSGPAFLSWQRMGNLRGWGGPLSEEWHKYTLNLQIFLVSALTDLGIIPALPAFAGFVPKAIKRVFPDAKVSEVEKWNNFPLEFCCPLFIDPTDPLFNHIGKMFLTEITANFGKSHIYYSDSFNEVKPTSDENDFLKNVSHSIYETMIDVDIDSVWMLQNWFFVNEFSYWTKERAESFLTSVPIGRLLILDLQSEQMPQFERFDMYFGQPFIWNMLHNFGGTLGMFGSVDSINENIYKTRNAINSTMIGIGITPEGINQNYVMYDLVLESPWNADSIDLKSWIAKYSHRRYGIYDEQINKAWTILMNSVYNFKGVNRIRGKYAITRRPSLNLTPWVWYMKKDLLDIWRLFLEANELLEESDGYRHDLVDITRQFLQYEGDQIYPAIIDSFKNKDEKKFSKYSQLFLNIFDDLEDILSSHHNFLLGNWLNSAKNISSTDRDKKLFEYNARNQITLWGPNGEISDYANKQWAGVVIDYFKPRWEIFINEMSKCLNGGEKFNKTKVKLNMFNKVEAPFTYDTKEYPVIAKGDTFQISKNIFDKWSHIELNLPDVPIKIMTKLPKTANEIDDFIKQDRDNDELNLTFPTIIMVN